MNMEFIDSPENITGLSGLVNKKKVKKNVDLQNIEQEMLRNFKSPKIANDAVSDFKQEMAKITKESGVDFGETWDPDELMADDDFFSKGSKKDEPTDPDIPSIDDEDIFGKNEPLPRYNPSAKLAALKNKNMKKTPSAELNDLFASSDDESPPRPRRQSSSMRHRNREEIQYTEDQRRQKNIDAFMGTIEEEDGEIYDLENAEMEDDKHRLLDRIDTLRTILEEDDVDISHIPEVDVDSEYDQVKYMFIECLILKMIADAVLVWPRKVF